MSYSHFTTSKNGKVVAVIVLHDETMDRLKVNDPGVLEGTLIAEGLAKMSPTAAEVARGLPVSFLDILIAYEPSQEAFLAKVKELGAAHDVLTWLCRGWTDRTGDGPRWVVPAAKGTMYSKPKKEGDADAE